MDESAKKYITERILGECWHEPIWSDNRGTICIKCHIGTPNNRTFTTWQDLGDVKDAIVKMGKWVSFYYWVINRLMPGSWLGNSDVINNLFRPVDEQGKPHFAKLVSEWWIGQKGEKG